MSFCVHVCVYHILYAYMLIASNITTLYWDIVLCLEKLTKYFYSDCAIEWDTTFMLKCEVQFGVQNV